MYRCWWWNYRLIWHADLWCNQSSFCGSWLWGCFSIWLWSYFPVKTYICFQWSYFNLFLFGCSVAKLNLFSFLFFSLRQVTSVSFSSCGTYFAASSTSNNTLVWDTRLLPMNHRQMSTDVSRETNDMRFFRPLHCLSHGRQMPTAEQTGQLPGWVFLL